MRCNTILPKEIPSFGVLMMVSTCWCLWSMGDINFYIDEANVVIEEVIPIGNVMFNCRITLKSHYGKQ